MNVYIQLVRLYAQAIKPLMPSESVSAYRACSTHQKWSLRHNCCVMLSQRKRVEKCLRKCLVMLDEDEITRQLINRLDVCEILRCEYSSIIFNPQRRRDLWLSQSWVEDVVMEILRVN